jgi:hypothetical protein
MNGKRTAQRISKICSVNQFDTAALPRKEVVIVRLFKLRVLSSAIAFAFALVSLFATSNRVFSQTGKAIVTDADATAGVHFTATAHVPYDFYIEGTHFPAGDYTISPVADSVLLFRNADAHAVGQAFLVPTGEAVPARAEKLLFELRNGRHCLTDVWIPNGKMVVTSQQGRVSAATEARTEVNLVMQTGSDQQRTADTR